MKEGDDLKNDYYVSDGIVYITLNRRKGENLIARVSESKLSLLKEFTGKWSAKWSNKTQSFYVQSSKYLGTFDGKPKYKTIYLHRFLTNVQNKLDVDHKDHDTLNNTDDNLRTLDRQKNSFHRDKANKNNSTGIKNISYSPSTDLYLVQISVNRKNTNFGSFKSLEEAIQKLNEVKEIYRVI